jgi:hypothetical protein
MTLAIIGTLLMLHWPPQTHVRQGLRDVAQSSRPPRARLPRGLVDANELPDEHATHAPVPAHEAVEGQ